MVEKLLQKIVSGNFFPSKITSFLPLVLEINNFQHSKEVNITKIVVLEIHRNWIFGGLVDSF